MPVKPTGRYVDDDGWGQLPNGPERHRHRAVILQTGTDRDRTTFETPAPEAPWGDLLDLSDLLEPPTRQRFHHSRDTRPQGEQ